MVPKALVFLLCGYLLLKIKRMELKWLYFGAIWSFVFLVTLYLSCVFVLDSTHLGLRTDFLAFTTIPIFLLLNSDKDALNISLKMVNILFVINFVFILIEIIAGNYLIYTGQYHWLRLISPIVSPEEAYPATRWFLFFNFIRPGGIFGNIHVSGFILYLYFIYLHFQPTKSWGLILLVTVAILLSLNLQIVLCLTVFLGIYYIPRQSLKNKLLLSGLIIALLWPIYHIYNPKKQGADSSTVIIKMTKIGIDRMSDNVFLFGIQFNPNKMRDDFSFTSQRGLRKVGYLYDSGVYTLVTRIGIVGIAVSIFFCLHLCYMFQKKKRRIAFAIVTSACITVIHYPVFLSAYGSFFFCILLMLLDRIDSSYIEPGFEKNDLNITPTCPT